MPNISNITCTDLTIPTGGTLTANSSTVTCSGDFTTSGGLLGASCLTLNGSSEYATATTADFRTADSAGTIEAWVKTSSSAAQTIFAAADTATANHFIHLRLAAGYVYIQQQDGAGVAIYDIQGSTTIHDGKWHHVAVVSSGSAISIYVDGREEALTVGAGSNNGDWFGDMTDSKLDNAVVGVLTTTSNAYYFNGSIDEVRVWSDARTVTEIRANMFSEVAADTAGLAHQWSFNEGTSTTINDTCSNVTDINLTLTPDDGGWAAAGTFTYGTSTLVMSGSSKKIYYNKDETFNKLTVSGTVSLFGVDETSAELRVIDDLNISGTLASTATEFINFTTDFTDNSGTVTIGGTVSGLYRFRSQATGTVTFPACTTPRIASSGSGGTIVAGGNLTVTEELRAESGGHFNSGGYTINGKAFNFSSTGTITLSNSAINMNQHSSAYITLDAGNTLATGNTTLIGYSAASKSRSWFPAAGGFEVVGDTKWLEIQSGSDLTVVGSVTDCSFIDITANIHQFHHTLDTQQLLDADEAGDDDMKLPRPSLDNALQLQTGG